jgi:hypothetical protein
MSAAEPQPPRTRLLSSAAIAGSLILPSLLRGTAHTVTAVANRVAA